MSKQSELERAIKLAHDAILAAINNRIVISKMGTGDQADILINLKRFLPTVEQIIQAAKKETE